LIAGRWLLATARMSNAQGIEPLPSRLPNNERTILESWFGSLAQIQKKLGIVSGKSLE
jgi:hypothetical protein